MKRQLSVVVGSVESSNSLVQCLEALRRTCRELDTEIIVVHAGGDETVAAAVNDAPAAILIRMPGDALTPRLWSEGLAVASGAVVAFTTAHCFVVEEWAGAMLATLERGASAAGGPLRLEQEATTVDAAIFFLRYSGYLEGRNDGETDNIAGDNSAYRTRDIPDGSWSRETGFWEHDVNRAIREAGASLHWTSRAVAGFGRSFKLSSICRHRFSHGRLFGISRVARGESAARIVLVAPLVPFVLAFRAARRAMMRREYRTRFLAALPYLLVIATFWAAGEAVGALD